MTTLFLDSRCPGGDGEGDPAWIPSLRNSKAAVCRTGFPGTEVYSEGHLLGKILRIPLVCEHQEESETRLVLTALSIHCPRLSPLNLQ